jgi:hypothetical protein
MTVDQEPQPPRREGAIGAVTDISARLIGTLPPAFLMLVLLNLAFLGMVMWFLADQIDRRTALVTQIVTRCMEIK